MKFSVVIPIYNEASSVAALHHSLKYVMENLKQPYQIIFVDDCSTDDSLKMLKRITDSKGSLTILSLNKRSGQSAAMQAGFDISRGKFIVTMDGDLQNDPKDIPKLWNKINEGFDIVCGWRYKREDPKNKVIISKIAGFLRRSITKEKVHDFGCTLRIFKREVLDKIYLFRGRHRFFTLMASKLGYRIGEIKVNHSQRKYGKSKYNISNRMGESLVDFVHINWGGKMIRAKSKIRYD